MNEEEPATAAPCPLPTPPLTLEAEFGDPTRHEVLTQGAWAIWYNPTFVDASEAQIAADFLQVARCRAVTDHQTPDAISLGAGHYVNVYLHEPGEEDGFPEGWGNGVGTNAFNLPYVTFPNVAWADRENVDHEAFHIFQYDSDAQGFEYAGDSGWYVETTANWFSIQPDLGSTTAYVTAGAIAGNPHLALWHGFDNARPEDPVHWMTETRQYGLQLFLQHLIETTALTDADAVSGFFTTTELLPQEYLAGIIGHAKMDEAWADFAALMTASFSAAPKAPMPDWVMTAAQRDWAVEERAALVALDPQPNIENDIAIEADLSEPFSGTLAPPDRLAPRPWSYNVVDLGAGQGAMTVTLNAAAPDDFELRLLRLMDGSWEISDLETGQQVGLGTTERSYIVVAATPEIYSGNQPLPYSLDIIAGPPPDGLQLIGGPTADQLIGGPGDDRLEGRGGDDRLTGGPGADLIDGGTGYDTAVATGAFSADRVMLGSTLRLQDGGLDTLIEIEQIFFENGTLLLDAPGTGVGFLFRLYDAVMDRTPDGPGALFWIDVMRGGASEAAVARSFLESGEYLQRYASLSNEAFVTLLYTDVLERSPDPDGADFWRDALDALLPREDALLAFSESPENVALKAELLGAGTFLEDDLA